MNIKRDHAYDLFFVFYGAMLLINHLRCLVLQAVQEGFLQQGNIGRLGDEMGGSQIQHFLNFLFIGRCGIDNDRRMFQFLHFFQFDDTFPPVHQGHVQIHKNKIRNGFLIVFQDLKGLYGIVGNNAVNRNAGSFDSKLKHFTVVMVIIDQKAD